MARQPSSKQHNAHVKDFKAALVAKPIETPIALETVTELAEPEVLTPHDFEMLDEAYVEHLETTMPENPSLDDTVLEALRREIEINEAAPPAIIDHHTQFDSWEEAPANDTSTVDQFEETLAAFDDDTVTAMTFKIARAVDERVAFEEDKNPENTSIQRTMKKVRSELVTKRAARVLLATNTEPAFINRTLHDGSRFNVYALGKYADLVRAIVDGHGLNNAINNAVTRSLFRCKNAGITFTGELAKASASDKIRGDAAVFKHLVRHTVSASTAPTQASSTMSALQVLGVVKIEGSTRHPSYKITEAPVAKFLERKLLAA